MVSTSRGSRLSSAYWSRGQLATCGVPARAVRSPPAPRRGGIRVKTGPSAVRCALAISTGTGAVVCAEEEMGLRRVDEVQRAIRHGLEHLAEGQHAGEAQTDSAQALQLDDALLEALLARADLAHHGVEGHAQLGQLVVGAQRDRRLQIADCHPVRAVEQRLDIARDAPEHDGDRRQRGHDHQERQQTAPQHGPVERGEEPVLRVDQVAGHVGLNLGRQQFLAQVGDLAGEVVELGALLILAVDEADAGATQLLEGVVQRRGPG